jgi:predicted ATP-grasp superfamily ATP-dependent carboligase
MNKLLILLFFSVSISGYAQNALLLKNNGTVSSDKIVAAGKDVRNLNALAIPADYYTKKFGFFCRQELKMQNAHVPVVFRVGTIDQCNYLEQKNDHR